MGLTRIDENDLLTALYGDVQERSPWRRFAERLRARTEADHCAIWIAAAASPPQWQRLHLARATGAASEPDAVSQASVFVHMRPGRVYLAQDLQNTTPPFGRYMRIEAEEGSAAMLIALNSDRRDFTARQSVMLSDLAPHLVIALRTYLALQRANRASFVSATLNARLAVGWVMLDHRGGVLDAGGLAHHLLDGGEGLRRTVDGRLRLGDADADALLDRVLNDPAQLAWRPIAAWLRDDPPLQVGFFAPLSDTRPGLATPACMMVVRQPGPPRRDAMPALLCDLYGLSRNEAVLAMGIAEGDSIVDVGARLNLTTQTARNYSKRIYAKTGARGQADLARIVLSGIAAADWDDARWIKSVGIR